MFSNDPFVMKLKALGTDYLSKLQSDKVTEILGEANGLFQLGGVSGY